jgi:hypothetical protein
MKKWLGCAAIAAALAVPSLAAAGELRLSIGNGRVTIVAQDVTVKQILDEWSRVGQTKIVGADRLATTLVTLELRDVAEGRALESVLRSASGYIAKPRLASAAAGASTIDCVLIMPASRAPVQTSAPPPFNAARPAPMVVNPNIADDDVDTPSPILPPGAMPPQPPPPQGQPVPPVPGQPPMQPGQQQTLPRPGMLPQPPNQPTNIPMNPYQNPPPPIRPPGSPSVPGPGGVPPQGGPGGGPGGDS